MRRGIFFLILLFVACEMDIERNQNVLIADFSNQFRTDVTTGTIGLHLYIYSENMSVLVQNGSTALLRGKTTKDMVSFSIVVC